MNTTYSRLCALLLCILIPALSAPAQGSPPDGWTAHWIAAPWSTERDGAELDGSHPMPVFQREFAVGNRLASAELRISGLGQWSATIGGKPVAPAGLHQAWTDYRKTITYERYDVRKLLTPGSNALEVTLGNGMYNVQHTKGRYTKFEGSFGSPKLIAELKLTYRNGRTETIVTDTQWKAAHSPVTFSSTYGGEDYDARKLQRNWQTAALVEGPGGTLIPAIALEVGEFSTLESVSKKELSPNRAVYDLGQNFAGIPHIRVHGAQGSVLKLTPGELLKPDGSVSQRSSGGPMWWSYKLNGVTDGEEWQPQFGYYGFRYLQAEWLEGDTPASPLSTNRIDEISGRAWHSASPVTGSFESSSKTLNDIHRLIVSAMHNNEASLFTDCPHREKLGWLEETHLVAPGLLFNNDLQSLFAATARNIADAQGSDGMVPTIVPQYTKFAPKYPIYDDSPEWGSATILAPWAAYRFYGDAAQLKQSYPVMQRFLTYLESKAVDGIVAYGLGDWYDIGPGDPGFEKNTSLGVTGTLMLYEDAAAMSRIALLLGHEDDAANYRTLSEREKRAFDKKFWNEKAGWYDTGSETANAMPLALGIVPEEKQAAVLAHVVADIHTHNDHITTGEVGYPYLLRVLMEAGRSDLLLSMMLKKDAPGYGAQLAAGATALTEAWDANPRSSQDHFMLGGAEEWFYRGLGGIDLDMSRAATAEKITIRPRFVTGVDWVRCGYASKLGKIESDWEREGEDIILTVRIPFGTKATVILPDTDTPRQINAGFHRFKVRSTS
jgi:alpha-L-rhamnosidase